MYIANYKQNVCYGSVYVHLKPKISVQLSLVTFTEIYIIVALFLKNLLQELFTF